MDTPVVKHQSTANTFSNSEQGTTTQQLVIDQIIKDLIHGTKTLEARCNSLTAENAALKTEMVSIKRLFDASADSGDAGNLTGYASSNVSTCADPKVVPVASTSEVEDLINSRIKEHVTTVTQILEEFQRLLLGETEERNKIHQILLGEIDERKTLVKQIEQDRRNVTGIKGRVGAFEKKIKDLQEDIKEQGEIAEPEPVQSKNPLYSHFVRSATASDGSGASLQEKVEQVQSQLNTALVDVRELRDNVHSQGEAVNELQLIVRPKGKGTTNGMVARSNGGANVVSADTVGQIRSLSFSIDLLKADMKALKADVKALTTTTNYERMIDNAKNKDELYTMYQQLGNDLWEDKKIGPFEGTEDELWALRERVVRRVALFEQHDAAMSEAKAAYVDL